MQGWESEWGGVGGIHLIENKKDLSIIQVPLTELKSSKISISWFLEDIDPVFKIFKNSSNGSPGILRTRLLQHL